MKISTLTSKISALTLVLFFAVSISSFATSPKEDPIVIGRYNVAKEDPIVIGRYNVAKEDPIVIGRYNVVKEDPIVIGR
ncbi:hypothetical protein E9993_10065 [Labilibacter sediminis]|nr:hypothetical protein E9993_10065 [Labilibacter sediminis]